MTMNHHCVPDFEMDEEYSPFPITAPQSASGLGNAKKSAMVEEEIMELLWENGQVVVHTQNQRSVKKSHVDDGDAAIPVPAGREVRSAEEEMATSHQHLFMQEDEMASWLHHYPLVESPIERYLSADLLYPASSSPASATVAPPRDIRAPEIRRPPVPSTAAPLPPIPPGRRTDADGAPRFQNFANFPRLSRPRIKPPGPSRETTVVESNETPIVRHVADSTAQVSGGNLGCGGTMSGTEAAATSTGAKEMTTTCELTVTSSPDDGSGASVSAEKLTAPATTEDRKRKGSETDEEGHNAETDFGSADNAKKQTRGVSSSSKRSRAAEVHNLSERKRRDRINEKMKALQELVPRCNKSDKASILDEAIEYLKSLQLQVQMMSLGHGCGMIPMMFPGIQQYMPAMGIGIGMGMGMGMGMNRPVAPYPTVLQGPAVPNVAAATPMGPRFPMLNSLIPHNSNQPPFPTVADPYKQNLGLHQAQVTSPMQNQMVEHPINNKPCSSKDAENPTTLQCG